MKQKVTKRCNAAIKIATGEYISFLYSDDYYLDDKIKTQVEILDSLDHTWGVVHGPVIRIDQNKFDKKESQTSKPTQNVASVNRSNTRSNRKTVRLTSSQVAIAKKLGVPLEEYAKQIKITEGA